MNESYFVIGSLIVAFGLVKFHSRFVYKAKIFSDFSHSLRKTKEKFCGGFD